MDSGILFGAPVLGGHILNMSTEFIQRLEPRCLLSTVVHAPRHPLPMSVWVEDRTLYVVGMPRPTRTT